jgi:hypothetical protein
MIDATADSTWKMFRRGLLLAAIMVGLWVTLSFVTLKSFELLYYRYRLSSIQERGYFGELFGPVNSLVSTLAFSGLLFTLWVQHLQYRAHIRRSVSQAQTLHSLHLFRRWCARDLVKSRAIISKYLSTRLEGHVFPTRLAFGSQHDVIVYGAILTLTTFFVEWSALVTTGNADPQLLRQLLGDQASEWRAALFDRLDDSAGKSIQTVRASFEAGLFIEAPPPRGR